LNLSTPHREKHITCASFAIACLLSFAANVSLAQPVPLRNWLSAATQTVGTSRANDTKRLDAQDAAANVSNSNLSVTVDVNTLFAHAKDEVRDIAVNDGKILRILGKRIIPGQNGARTWLGAVIDEGREFDVFITELDGHIVGANQNGNY
jgi:hypothetical protein